MDNARQAGGGQHDKSGWWMMQDERVANNVGQSGGEQHKAIWRWTTRQEEGGGRHNAELLGGGRHNKRGDSNVIIASKKNWKAGEKGIGNVLFDLLWGYVIYVMQRRNNIN
jgi:hypothetical protein